MSKKRGPVCPTCKRVILDGETIIWDKEKKIVYHGGCFPRELKSKEELG